MKKREQLKELRDLDSAGLKSKVESLQQEMMNLRFRHQAGQLAQSAQIQNIRRQIARAHTELGKQAK